jgi:hypothetical protein
MTDDGSHSELVTRLQPRVWDVARDGTIVGILEGEHRAMKVVRISATGALLKQYPVVRQFPVTLEPLAYGETVRALRVSPDGTRLLMDYMNPQADVWIREGPW